MSKTINLLPDPVLETQKEVSTVFQGTLVSIIGLIVFVLVNLIILFFLLSTTNKYEAVQQNITNVQEEINSYAIVKSNLQTMRTKMQRFLRIDIENIQTDETLADMITSQVPEVDVNKIEYANNEIRMTAVTSSLEKAVEFLRGIKRNEMFSSLVVNDVGYQGLDSIVLFRTTVMINKP